MVYDYTKPRRLIGAMYSSPGPRYSLPSLCGADAHDPRSKHIKNPSYSLGPNHPSKMVERSPGPIHLPEDKVYHDGKCVPPQYSLHSRTGGLMPGFKIQSKTPGPGCYKPEAAGPMAHYHAPEISFGQRPRSRRLDFTPAPNAYGLDSMVGKTVRADKKQAPIYTMRPKYMTGAFNEDLSKTPGPLAYPATDQNLYNTRQPESSIHRLCKLPVDATRKPGPGAHYPEEVQATRRRAPASSFGIRHSEYSSTLTVDNDF